MTTTQTPEREEIIQKLEFLASDYFVKLKSFPRESPEWRSNYTEYSLAKYLADYMRQHRDEEEAGRK